jgi:hypothetical protein
LVASKKPFWWSFLLVILGTIYLVPEAIFNSELVSLVGLGTPSSQDLEHLELYGRTMSGIGVTLLLADLLPSKFIKNPIIGMLSLALLLAVVWPTVFFGQKYLIEKAVIESSSAQQRQHAVFSAAVRDALAANVVNIKGVEYNPKFSQSPENLTFLSLFGGLLYADANLSDSLEEDKREIIHKFVEKRAYDKFESHYAKYATLYDKLSANYKEYAQASTEYNDVLDSIPKKEAKYWSDLETEVSNSYDRYQQAQKAHVAKSSARAQKYGPSIFEYFEQKNACQERYKKSKYKERLKQCTLKLQARYKTRILEAGMGYIDPGYWLIAEEVSTTENVANTIFRGILTGGLSTILQAASAVTGGDGGIKDFRYKYTSDPDHYQLRILQHPKFHEMFEKETGYPFTIDEMEVFRQHTQTQKRIKNVFAKKNLDLSSTWTINNRNEFALAVDKKIKREVAQKWQKGIAKQGLSMPPNLTWQEFQLHVDVQARISKQMGDKYVDNTMADWNKSNFKKYIIMPNIERKTTEYLNAINSALVNFENNGKYAEYGKQALRSVVIPPISMFLSLFLICLTLAKLPTKYWAIITYNKPAKEESSELVTFISKIYMPALILLVPLFFMSNLYTKDKDSTANYFLKKVEESSVPLFSYLLQWTLHTQPFLHPLGESLESALVIYKGFEPYAKKLHRFDLDVMKSNNVLSAEQKKDLAMKRQGKAMLNVMVSGQNATKIQIMNIVPSYRADMLLAPGIYDLKITYKNGRIYRKKHQLDPGYHVLDLRNQ